MTQNYEVPYIQQLGNGSLVRFTYAFRSLENEDVQVWLENVRQIEGVHYDYENVTDSGGDIVFYTAPALDAVVTILRRTPITQQVDYVDTTAFPAETHELGADKLIMILQEFIDGGLAPDEENSEVDFDLSVSTTAATVVIENAAGTDATIPPWDSAEDAGAFLGEITLSAPADDSATAQPDGYIWLEVAATP